MTLAATEPAVKRYLELYPQDGCSIWKVIIWKIELENQRLADDCSAIFKPGFLQAADWLLTGELTVQSLEASVKELIDRQKIWDCLLRYTRGVDRLDRTLMLSAFAENALIDQGSFKGSREDLANWVLTYHENNQLLTQHMMTNHFCEFTGDVAHTETIVAYYGTNPTGKDAFAVGRYIDRLVRQSDDWVISDRVCTTEGASDFEKNGLLATLKPLAGSIAVPTRDRADPSYRRPLVIPRFK